MNQSKDNKTHLLLLLKLSSQHFLGSHSKTPQILTLRDCRWRWSPYLMNLEWSLVNLSFVASFADAELRKLATCPEQIINHPSRQVSPLTSHLGNASEKLFGADKKKSLEINEERAITLP